MIPAPNPPVPLPDPIPHPARDLAHRLDAIFFALLHYIGYAAHALARFADPAYLRIHRAGLRLRRILHRVAAGTFPPPRPARPHAPKRPGGKPAPYLSRRRGWLGHIAGFQLRCVASQLHHLLNEPATAPILAAAPPHARAAMARAIATTARLLDIDLPAALRLPPKPPKPRPARPPKPPRPQPDPPGTPDRPLPRYILAAARYDRRRYGPDG